MPKSKNLLVAAYANTLTGLIPDLYEGLDIVSRELVGFIPSVDRNFSAERAAVGENVRVPVTQSGTTANIVPAMTIPEPTDRTVDYTDIVITKSKAFNFGFTGEEMRGLNNGPGARRIEVDWFMQGIRALTNEIEQDIATAAYLSASRATGTAGTTPFASTLGDSAQVRKILDDNGAPQTDRSLVIDTAAGASLRTLSNLTRANEAGTTMTLRDGELLNVHGLSIKESAQIQRPVIGTASNTADVDTTGYAVGATTIGLASAGSGTILAGDYITIAGDTNVYLVKTGDADVSGGGSITIAAPGLRQAISTASGQAITVVARSARNIAFHRNAIQLVCRAPELPNGTDAAIDSMMMTDPRSGLSFEIRVYEAYRKMRAEIGCAWGVKVIKDAHVAALLG